jgi:hypothetical protein
MRPPHVDPTPQEIAERSAIIKAENGMRDPDETLPARGRRPSHDAVKPSSVCRVARKAMKDAEDDDGDIDGLITDDRRWDAVLAAGDTDERRLAMIEGLRRRVWGR